MEGSVVAVVRVVIEGESGVSKAEELDSGRLVVKRANLSAPNMGTSSLLAMVSLKYMGII